MGFVPAPPVLALQAGDDDQRTLEGLSQVIAITVEEEG